MSLHERIGVDIGRKIGLEEGLEWAARKGVRYIDVECDVAPNALGSFDAGRCGRVRALTEKHGIKLGLHTLSGVNIAEYSPFMTDAADQYLKGYIDLALKVDAGWVIVHAGYHFTGDYEARRTAALERLKRAVGYAEQKGVKLLLENTNKEPVDAEVRYFGYNLEETKYFFDRISSPQLGWSFTVNHAHMVPEGIDGTIDGMGMARCGEVRLADNKGDKEEHLFPGQGTIDFKRMFQRIEAAGFKGHYMNAFGSLDDMARGRDVLVKMAGA
jgi:sugar phosphate isomerase/epimerase